MVLDIPVLAGKPEHEDFGLLGDIFAFGYFHRPMVPI